MAVAANKRSVMTLFSGANDMFSHQVRIVLAEKGVSVDICQVDPANLPDELAELNPYQDVHSTSIASRSGSFSTVR